MVTSALHHVVISCTDTTPLLTPHVALCVIPPALMHTSLRYELNVRYIFRKTEETLCNFIPYDEVLAKTSQNLIIFLTYHVYSEVHLNINLIQTVNTEDVGADSGLIALIEELAVLVDHCAECCLLAKPHLG